MKLLNGLSTYETLILILKHKKIELIWQVNVQNVLCNSSHLGLVNKKTAGKIYCPPPSSLFKVTWPRSRSRDQGQGHVTKVKVTWPNLRTMSRDLDLGHVTLQGFETKSTDLRLRWFAYQSHLTLFIHTQTTTNS